VRRVAPILFMLAFCVLGAGLPGCSLFKKSDPPPPPPPQNQLPPPRFPTGDPLNKSAAAAPAGGTAILAGRVLDGNARPPVNTSILVVRLDQKEEKTESDVPVSPEGYFTVNNLAPGASYKLVARGKTGDRMVAGINVVTAPSPRVLIQMREDLVAANTPPLPAPFDSLKEKRDPAFAKETIAAPTVAVLPPTNDPPVPFNPGNTSWQPGNGGVNATVPAGGLPPVQIPVAGENGPIAQMRGGLAVLPTMEIGNPRVASIRPVDVPMPTTLPARPRDSAENLGQARVPSCVLVGNQLVNFALADINGDPWELRTNRKGKLVLLDFWGTWCGPCKMTMPTLKGLQQQYGPAGLEVIGIAYENGGTREEQAHQVDDTCKRLLVNYRQLLGSGPNCVVKRELGVRALPTLILVDDRGTILWRHVGVLSDGSRSDLERILQTQLRPTAY
jgi:thiol-disulfide isomerase/thioredoxin